MVTMKRQQRPAPVLRVTVTVKGKPYDCLINRHDPDAAVFVSSGSQAGAYWSVVWDGMGRAVCGCVGWDFRQACAHTVAAEQARAAAQGPYFG